MVTSKIIDPMDALLSYTVYIYNIKKHNPYQKESLDCKLPGPAIKILWPYKFTHNTKLQEKILTIVFS